MTHEPNPYAPPEVDPAAPNVYPDSGSLWRIADGRLQVRNQASLPDVCIYGSPEREPGTRSSIVFNTTPEFVVGITWIALGLALIAGLVPRELTFPMIFIVLAPMLFGKKVRVLAFRSGDATRSAGVRNLVSMVISIAVDFALARYASFLPWRIPTLAAMALVFGVVRLVRFGVGKRFGWARFLKDGWFEIPGIAPAAIVRLEEIQRRLAVPQQDPAPRLVSGN
jgi:hypothetical protein